MQIAKINNEDAIYTLKEFMNQSEIEKTNTLESFYHQLVCIKPHALECNQVKELFMIITTLESDLARLDDDYIQDCLLNIDYCFKLMLYHYAKDMKIYNVKLSDSEKINLITLYALRFTNAKDVQDFILNLI